MSNRGVGEFAEQKARAWEIEAHQLELSRSTASTAIERRLIEMHARVKRACAQDLRLEASRMTRGR